MSDLFSFLSLLLHHSRQRQLLNTILKLAAWMTFFLSSLSKSVQEFNEDVSVHGSVVALGFAERPLLPIGQLLTFAELLAELLSHCRSKTNSPSKDHAIVLLDIYEVDKLLVEIHSWEVPLKVCEITFEIEANAKGVRMGENLSQNLVKILISRQRYQVYQVGYFGVTQLE